MELNEFAVNYPELYEMFDNDISYAIAEYKITGEEPLKDWNNMIDRAVKNYEKRDYYGYDKDEMMEAQQINRRFRDTDGRNFHRRRRFRDFNIRDIIRLLFLRKLFD